jgi:hypothetical protein
MPGDKDLLDEIENLMGGGEEAAALVEGLRHGEGLITDGKSKAYQGVLQKIASAIPMLDTEAQYRQALLLSAFLDRDDAGRVIAALDERRRYGVDITPVIDLVTAWAAIKGASGGRIDNIVESLTHQSISANTQAYRKGIGGRFGGKKDSPIS